MDKQLPWWREITRAQWMSFLAAWVGWVLDAFDFTIYIVVAGSIIKEFGVSPLAIGGSLTLTLLVRMAGGMVAGWMADRWGRRLPLMISLVWFAVFDAAIYFAPTFGTLLVLRTLFGFGMGAEWTAGTALAMESFPPRSRKFASGLLQAGWPVGFLLAAVTAYFVVPAFGWRAMFLIAALPAVLVIPIRFMVKDEGVPADAVKSTGAVKDLMSPAVLKMLILGSLVSALGFIVYYGLTTPYMGLHLELGFTAANGYINLIWFNVGMLVGVIAAGAVANRWGVIAALVAPALAMVVAMPLFVGLVPSLMSVGAFLGGCLGAGYSGVTPVLTTSLFPEHVRARAIGIVYHAGALIAAFVPSGIPWLAKTCGWSMQLTVGIVVTGGLIAMSAAVLATRKLLTQPSTPAPAIEVIEGGAPPAPSVLPGQLLAPKAAESSLHAN